MTSSTLIANDDYHSCLEQIKHLVSSARLGMALAVNRTLICQLVNSLLTKFNGSNVGQAPQSSRRR